MGILWKCTGKSQHSYEYKRANGEIDTCVVTAIDYVARINPLAGAGAVNELFDTKPVLTEAGVEAFIGLQVYPQGFTVYADERISNTMANGVVAFGTELKSASVLLGKEVGETFTTGGGL